MPTAIRFISRVQDCDDYGDALTWAGAATFSSTIAANDDVTLGDGKKIMTDQIRARDGDGLKLYEDGGAGLFVKDGGDVGIGRSPSNHVDIFDQTIDTTSSYLGLYVSHHKTAGATDHDDTMTGMQIDTRLNQSGGEISNLTGFKTGARLVDGNIGDGSNSRHLYGTYSDVRVSGGHVYGTAHAFYNYVYLTGGTIDSNVYAVNTNFTQAVGSTVSGSIFGNYVGMNSGGTVSGNVYMIYLSESAGVDYGIYQSGTGDNRFGGQVEVENTAAKIIANRKSGANNYGNSGFHVEDAGTTKFTIGFPYDNASWAQSNDKLVIGTNVAIGNALVTIKNSGEVGIGTTAPVAPLDAKQGSASGAKPVVRLEQLDQDQEFLNLVGTSAADQTKSISTVNGDGSVEGPKNYSASAGWAFEGMARVAINGTDRWVPYYSEDTS